MRADEQIGTIGLSAFSLDSVFGERRLCPPSLIKLDVEGSKLDLLTCADVVVGRFRRDNGRAPWTPAIVTPKEQLETSALEMKIRKEFQGR